MRQPKPWNTGISIILLSTLSVLPSCRSGTKGTDGSEAVAVVGDEAITLEEVKAKLGEQPAFVRARYDSLEKKKEFVDGLVRFELLAQEARKRGLEKDPEVQAMLEKVMVQRLIKAVAEEGKSDVGEAEARKYYDAHLDEFVRPERVRLGHIYLAAPRGDAERARRKAEAAQLLASLKAPGAPAEAFEEAARSKSEDAESRGAGGDLGFRTKQELEQLGGSGLAQLAFSLRTVGEVGALVESERGFHLVRLSGRQPGLEQSFESVKTRIQNRLGAERRSKSLDELIAGLRKSADVSVNEEVLKKLNVRALAEGQSTP